MEATTSEDTSADGTSDDETGEGETGEDETTGDEGSDPTWGEGPRTVSGRAYFFEMPILGEIEWVTDVDGAEVFVFEAPQLRVSLSQDEDHVFSIEGIPDGVDVTLALEHPDFYPLLTATIPVDGADLTGLSFQAVSHVIATGAAALVGADASDPTRCQMATTVSAAGAEDIWAIGEPDATVTTDPAVPLEQGPYYFNTDVIPDLSLMATTTDGGVLIADAEPGTYVWYGHKEGLEFEPLTLRCEAGWLTNASPPWGLNVVE